MASPTGRLSPHEIGGLVNLVDQGRWSEAESRADRLLVQNPDAGVLWKILGVVLARQEKDALNALRRAVELLPNDSEAHRNLAAAWQIRGDWAQSLKCLHRALELRPDDADGFAEAADAMRALGRTNEAVPLYERALLLNARLVEARNNLGNAHLEMGRHLEAARCYQTAAAARPDDVAILCNLGNAQRLLGEREAAIESFRRALKLNLRDAHTLNRLGHVLRDLGARRDALQAFERVIALDPKRAEHHDNLGTALFDLRRVGPAIDSFRSALVLQPDYAPAHLHLGLAMRQQRRFADAEASCRAALAIDPNCADALSFLGELLADRGEFTSAEKIFQQVIALDPDSAAAYGSIAIHRKMTVNDTEWLHGAQAALTKGLPLPQETGLRFALGKYFDDIGLYDLAFEHYHYANEKIRRYGAKYDRETLIERVDGLIRRFDAAFVRRARTFASSSELPIFIVGMPRSGTSLTEQILASHASVFGAGEVVFWNSAYDDYTSAERAGDDLDHWLTQTAEEYLAALAPLAGGVPRVVDKMPANFLYAGLIHAVLPKARIIHMQRNPIDTCLSVYFQNFFNIGPYAHDLDDLAHYYSEYVRITDHWRSVLPAGALLEVPYEKLIENQEEWTRRMLDFTGLPWDASCLDFHRTKRVVITASKWQVRQPIHAASAGRWRHYEKHVGPLLRLVDSRASVDS